MKSVLSAAIVLVVLFPCCVAFPNGPGSCVGGRSAAVGHETPSPIPSFADQGYSLVIDGQVVSDPSTVSLAVGSSYEIAVESTGSPFRGALIRVEGMGTLTPGQNSGIASVCTGDVQGVGHTNSGSKRVLSGNLAVEGGSSFTIDVTVVQQNTRDDSVYSYQGYQLAVGGGAAPMAAPVAAPTNAPVVSPTVAPVVAPTDAPVVSPTEAPVVAPTDAPVVSPTDAPVVAPTDAPVVAPTEMPVMAPVAVPTDMPVVTPTEAPVMAPVAAPTDMPVVSPTESPVVAPVAELTEAPVMAPVAAPVASPMAAPVGENVERCVRRRRKN